MKKLRFLSTILCIAMVICLLQPVVYAAEEVGDVTTIISDEYAVCSFENSEKLYNIIVLREIGQVQFALTRQSEPDICYEYIFDLPNGLSVESENFWDSVQDICFDNENDWRQIVMNKAVQVVENSSSSTSTFAADPYVAYFEEWLAEKNGKVWAPLHFSDKVVDGITFSWDFYRRHSATKDYTYIIKYTMTAASFITGVLGAVYSNALLKVISSLTGTAGKLLSGSNVYKYKLITISCYAMTANGGTYPYSMAGKHIVYTGYVYDETGNWAVDTESLKEYYDPSEEYYLSYTQQLNAAYAAYLDLGDMG